MVTQSEYTETQHSGKNNYHRPLKRSWGWLKTLWNGELLQFYSHTCYLAALRQWSQRSFDFQSLKALNVSLIGGCALFSALFLMSQRHLSHWLPAMRHTLHCPSSTTVSALHSPTLSRALNMIKALLFRKGWSRNRLHADFIYQPLST